MAYNMINTYKYLINIYNTYLINIYEQLMIPIKTNQTYNNLLIYEFNNLPEALRLIIQGTVVVIKLTMFLFGIYSLVHLILLVRNPDLKGRYTTAQYKVGFTSAVIFIIGPEFFFVPFVSLIFKSVSFYSVG